MSLISNMKRAILSSGSRAPQRHQQHKHLELHSGAGGEQCHECPPGVQLAPFWGVDDYISAADWIDLYDAITSDFNYTNTNKAIRLGGHLRKYALSWYVQEVKSGGGIQEIDWDELKESFKKNFTLCDTIANGSDASSIMSSFGC